LRWPTQCLVWLPEPGRPSPRGCPPSQYRERRSASVPEGAGRTLAGVLRSNRRRPLGRTHRRLGRQARTYNWHGPCADTGDRQWKFIPSDSRASCAFTQRPDRCPDERAQALPPTPATGPMARWVARPRNGSHDVPRTDAGRPWRPSSRPTSAPQALENPGHWRALPDRRNPS
jgi:hypothetical protein